LWKLFVMAERFRATYHMMIDGLRQTLVNPRLSRLGV
jgi:hypothetical protein